MRTLIACFTSLFLLCSSPLLAQDKSPFLGIWKGAIDVQGISLDLIFQIAENDSLLTCEVDVPLQGAKGIPASAVEVTAENIQIAYPIIGALYEGQLADEGRRVNGVWSQNGQVFELNLEKKENKKELGLIRPQTPKAPFPYQIDDYFFENREEQIFLAGTLTLPPGNGPFPAAILISGSGPQNRNEEILGHQPFWVIADYLTRRGIAVFRYDDRGVGQSRGNFEKATTVHFAKDVGAAMDFLKQQGQIDSTKIGLIGHSEGGIVAPMVATQRTDVAFAILLAAPSISLKEILIMQSTLINRAAGTPEAKIQRDSIFIRQKLSLYAEERELQLRNQKLREVGQTYYDSLSDQEKKEQGDFETFFSNNTRGMDTPWLHFLLTYQPASALEKMACPTLAINGGLDLQVPAKINLRQIEKSLQKGPCMDFHIQEIAEHNHLFQKTKTGAFSEYAINEETFSEKVMQVMVEWIQERF